MFRKRWSNKDMQDQTGRVALVTGANSGVGLETARALARRGAHVVLACRNRERGEAALRNLREEPLEGSAQLELLDLASLESVAETASRMSRQLGRLDLLVNNAAVLKTPPGRTRDGFELQLGINHLGHFALTGRLLPLLCATPGSRVVTVSSVAHRREQASWEPPISFRKAYHRSKLANLLFTLELQDRLSRAQVQTLAVSAHPGWTNTKILQGSPLLRWTAPLLAMPPSQGAWPSLFACTDPGLAGGVCIGPDGPFQLWGHPARVSVSRRARHVGHARRLWELSEAWTGIRFLLD